MCVGCKTAENRVRRPAMGKEHKKRKKHKRPSSKHGHKSKDVEYHVPVVPLKCDMRPKPAAPPTTPSVSNPIGPVLPAAEVSSSDNGGKTIADGPLTGERNDSYGPSLPPHLVQQKRVPGPMLPLDFKPETTGQPQDDDITGFGPLPAELIKSDSEQLFVQKQLELRAEYMKRKFAGEVSFCSLVEVFSRKHYTVIGNVRFNVFVIGVR